MLFPGGSAAAHNWTQIVPLRVGPYLLHLLRSQNEDIVGAVESPGSGKPSPYRQQDAAHYGIIKALTVEVMVLAE